MKMTYGFELEVGDVNRRLVLPEWAGSWEYAETDVVNLRPPYRNVACDPLGLAPPVGGEVNILPARSPEELVGRIQRLLDWFKTNGTPATAGCVNHGHVHVRVPGLRDDMEALGRLTTYIKRWQSWVIERVYQYREHPEMSQVKTAKTYLKWDGGRPMPDWMADNIGVPRSFEDFIRIQCCGRDGVSRGRPFRYAINTYCLKHTDTVEFRCLRASTDAQEIYDSILFAEKFMRAALENPHVTPGDIIEKYRLRLPKFAWDLEQYRGWERTKWDKSRGRKERRFVDV